MSLLEQVTTNETKIIKEHYCKASSAIKDTQIYFLNEVQDDEVISTDMFIDNVLHFANEPSKQIQVLKELAKHLQKVNKMLDQPLIETT